MATLATDAELVRRYLAGDQRALGDIYERYGDKVYDLCFAMLSSADDAADAYQDTFLTAARKLGDLRDPERLRSWLYSIARNQCRARHRARKRTTLDEDAGLAVGVDVDMTAEMHRAELRELMSEASAGLNDRDREVLELHMRHELEGEELADALGVSVQNAYKLVQRVRDRVERSLGSLLVARHARNDCPDLDQLLAGWDGTFSPLMRKRIGRHVDDCETCSRRRAGLMDPGGLAGAYPMQTVPADLKAQVLSTLLAGQAPSHEIRRWNGDGFPAEPRRAPRILLGAVAAGLLLLGGIAGGLAIADVRSGGDSTLETVAPVVTEAPATVTTPAPETTAAPATTAPETTAPETTAPETTAPETTAPETTAPETTSPPVTAPPSTEPPTTDPPTTDPPTTDPPTTDPPDSTPPTIDRLLHSPNNNRTDPLREAPCAPVAGGPPIDTLVSVSAVTSDDVGTTSVTVVPEFNGGATGTPVGLSSTDGVNWTGSFEIPASTVAALTTFSLSGTATDAAGNTSSPETSAGGLTFIQPC